MKERELYDNIGEWLIENKDCQNNDYFQGYTKEPEIRDDHGKVRKPDVVGIRYEREDGETPSFAFDYYFVEVKRGSTSTDVNNLFGELESLKHLVEMKGVNVAARKAGYYVAFENEVPNQARDMAKDKGYGVLLVETDEEDILNVRERREPEVSEVGKETVVPNSSQRSPGNFMKEIQGTKDVPQLRGALVLKNVMTDPKEFYESEMKPLKEQAERRRKREKAIRKDPTGKLDEIIDSLEEIDTVELSISEDTVRVETVGEEALVLKILTDKIKFLDSEEELLFRIMKDGEIHVFDSSIDDLEEIDGITRFLEDRVSGA